MEDHVAAITPSAGVLWVVIFVNTDLWVLMNKLRKNPLRWLLAGDKTQAGLKASIYAQG